jgi:hypothetical protein
METGSYMTAHTTSQTFQSTGTAVDWTRAVSGGIFAGIIPLFWSLETPTVFQADF